MLFYDNNVQFWLSCSLSQLSLSFMSFPLLDYAYSRVVCFELCDSNLQHNHSVSIQVTERKKTMVAKTIEELKAIREQDPKLFEFMMEANCGKDWKDFQ